MAGNLTAMIAAAFSGGAAPPVTSDPYYEYTTLLLPGNGTNGAQNNTFLDGSTNNFTITRNGNTTQGTFSPFSQTGWGNYFDGSSGYLTTPANTAFAFGTGDFTVEMFVNTSNITNGGFVSHGPSATSGYWMFELSGGTFFWQASGVANIIVVSASSYLSNSVWTHLCVSRVSGTTRMFANGTQIASATDNTNYSGSSSGSLSIGRSYNGTYTTGYISNLRIVKGTGVTTVTVPTAPLTAISGTSILTCQSNRFIDNSTNNFTITRNGDTRVVAFSPFNPTASWSAATYGGSGYFDGSGDYLTATTSSLNTTTFTLEFWGYFTVLNSGSPYYVFNLSGGGSGQLLIGKNDPGFPGRCLFVDNSGSTVFNLQGGTINANEWTHFACVKDGANASLWINGTRVATTSSAATSPTFSGTSAFWGGLNSSVAVITGYLSSFRLVSGSAVYSTSSTSITVPTAPPTAIANTSLLLNYTNGGIYDATSKNDLETVGNAQISTTQSKWGGSSMAFDGTGDYLGLRNSVLFDFGSGDFTVEAWLYIAGNSSLDASNRRYAAIFSVGTTSAYDFIFNLRGNSTTTGTGIEIYNLTNGVIGVNGTITQSVWNHIAVSKSGSSVYFWLNGTQLGTTQTGVTGSWGSSSNNAQVARGAVTGYTYELNGYLQDLRITRGYARYTANFTAPTAAFPTL